MSPHRTQQGHHHHGRVDRDGRAAGAGQHGADAIAERVVVDQVGPGRCRAPASTTAASIARSGRSAARRRSHGSAVGPIARWCSTACACGVRLEPNDWGISFDLHFWDTTRQVFREPVVSAWRRIPPGRRPDITTGFESFGEVEGWVEVDGTAAVRSGHRPGYRDRHWGIGRGWGPDWPGGAEARRRVRQQLRAFRDFTIWGDKVFYPFGDSRPGAGRVVGVDRRLRFEADNHIFLEGLVDYTLERADQAAPRPRIGDQTAYLRCGMYGGTPVSGIHQGGYAGQDLLVEGDVYDVTRPEVRAALAGLDEHLCRVTCDGETTTGLYQPIDPNAYRACGSGRPGWAFLE